MKYDPDGYALWVEKLSGTDGNCILNSIATLPIVFRNICFPPGTLVSVDQGDIPIEKLQYLKHTIRGEPIVAIVKTRNVEKHLVKIDSDALSPGIPCKTTYISLDHKVFVQGQWVPAKFLVGHCGEKVTYDGDILYNVLLEKHSHMKIHNMQVETLHPKNPKARKYFSNTLVSKK